MKPSDRTPTVESRMSLRDTTVRSLLVLTSSLFVLPGGSASGAQESAASSSSVQVPPDTYENPALAELMRRVRAARTTAATGLDTYAATLKHRVYVGLTARRFRRERGIFEQERIGRVRWSSDGSELIQWQGMRATAPIMGLDTRRGDHVSDSDHFSTRASTEMAEDLTEELLEEDKINAFDLDPFADRLWIESDEVVHPLADDAPLHYRYLAGDTLELDLPGDLRDIVLFEVRVEPRRTDFNLLAASLWIDSESDALVRAGYRPARPFNMGMDAPDDEAEVPGWLRGRLEMEISYVAVEYSLHEMEYWLPRRYAFDGEARFVGLVELPVTLEWSLSQYSVNDGVPATAPEAPPLGWRMRTYGPDNPDRDSLAADRPAEDTLRPTRTIMIPPAPELLNHPELSGNPVGNDELFTFSEFEVSSLTSHIDLVHPRLRRTARRYFWGLDRNLFRYNRVEGLSLGAATELPIGSLWTVTGSARIGTGDLLPYATVGIRRAGRAGEWSFKAFHELRTMSDTHDPFTFGSTLSGLIFGNDRGEYFRAAGIETGYEVGGRTSWSLAAFAERHASVELGSTFSLRSLFGDKEFPPVLPADDGNYLGVRASMKWFSGLDPNELVVTGSLYGEAATGEIDYSRLQAALSLSHPLTFRLAGAIEVAGGHSWGAQLPMQRRYFLGDESFRGTLTNELTGDSFWRTRGEVATGLAAARIGLFTDVGAVGSGRDRLSDPLVSAGVGFSLLDGIYRIDIAKGIRGIDRWRLHFYMDGIL